MSLPRRRGFTLIEILIVVMLTGMVGALALAPVVMTVRRTVEIQESWSDTAALSRTLAFIGRDVSAALRLAQTALIVQDHQFLGGGEDDVLIVMSASPTRQQLAAGSLVYKIDRGGPMKEDMFPGLYRWLLPGKRPEDVDVRDLKDEEAQLVLPGVTAFNVEVPKGREDRDKEYQGALPTGLFIALTRGEGEGAETLEEIVVFP